jgi:hypothetical protein
MKLRNTAIALGIGAATAAGLSLLKVNKDLVIGSTAVVVGAGLMIALKDKEDLNFQPLTGKELLDKIDEWGDKNKLELIKDTKIGLLTIQQFLKQKDFFLLIMARRELLLNRQKNFMK